MKKAAGVFVLFAAAFLGVFAAFRVERWIDQRNQNAPTIEQLASLNPGPVIEPAQFRTSGAPFDFRTAAKRVTASVVSVDRSNRIMTMRGVQDAETGTGSGVILSSDGFIVTNNHVIEGGERISVRLNNNRSYTARVVGADPRTDIALLKIDGAPSLTPIELGNSSQVEVGQWVMAVGNPLGYDNTVSVGVVSSLGRTLDPGMSQSLLSDAIQTDAAINSGNSGGALTDDRGRLIGINTAIATPNRGSVGIGFAIPVNRVRRVVDELRQNGRVRYGATGLRTFPFTLSDPRAREALRQETGSEPPQAGLIISNVVGGGPAATAGINFGDVLLQIDSKPLRESTDLVKYLLDKRPGERVRVKVWSQGETRDLTLTLVDLERMRG